MSRGKRNTGVARVQREGVERQEMRLKTYAGQSKQDLVSCVSKTSGKTMKGFKHGGNTTTPACFFFNHCDFSMKKYIKQGQE